MHRCLVDLTFLRIFFIFDIREEWRLTFPSHKIKNHPKVVVVFLGGPGRNRPGPRMSDPAKFMNFSVFIKRAYLIIPFNQSSALSNEAGGTSR